jgi:hypothetical protein
MKDVTCASIAVSATGSAAITTAGGLITWGTDSGAGLFLVCSSWVLFHVCGRPPPPPSGLSFSHQGPPAPHFAFVGVFLGSVLCVVAHAGLFAFVCILVMVHPGELCWSAKRSHHNTPQAVLSSVKTAVGAGGRDKPTYSALCFGDRHLVLQCTDGRVLAVGALAALPATSLLKSDSTAALASPLAVGPGAGADVPAGRSPTAPSAAASEVATGTAVDADASVVAVAGAPAPASGPAPASAPDVGPLSGSGGLALAPVPAAPAAAVGPAGNPELVAQVEGFLDFQDLGGHESAKALALAHCESAKFDVELVWLLLQERFGQDAQVYRSSLVRLVALPPTVPFLIAYPPPATRTVPCLLQCFCVFGGCLCLAATDRRCSALWSVSCLCAGWRGGRGSLGPCACTSPSPCAPDAVRACACVRVFPGRVGWPWDPQQFECPR